MVLRPEGRAELQEALQGGKVREDIYILRRLHHGNEDDALSPVRVEPAPDLPPTETVLTRVPPGEPRAPEPRPEPRARKHKTPPLVTYTFSAPPTAGPDDLPSLIRWFLSHDPLVPNNLQVLEEAHRILCGAKDSRTYERHLAQIIADDLRTYDSPELLEEHLSLLTTVYARTLRAFRRLGSQRPYLQSPVELPEGERQEMWELSLKIGLTATRLRVEGWVYQLRYGVPPTMRKAPGRRRSGPRMPDDPGIRAKTTHD